MKSFHKETAPRVVGAALLALALGTALVTPASAQPAANGPDVAAAGKIARKRGDKAKAAPMVSSKMLEKVLGKPLTDDQKKAVEDAAKVYEESVAKAVGLTPAELDAKVKEYRKAHKGDKKDKAA